MILIAQLIFYLNLCASSNLIQLGKLIMSKQIIHKLSILEAKNIAANSLFIERLHPVFYITTSRQNYTPRI